MNRENIISEICVEKNLEVNTCQGNCHLKDLLSEENNNQSESKTETKLKFQVEENIIPNKLELDLSFKDLNKKLEFPIINNEVQYPFLKLGTPPPQV